MTKTMTAARRYGIGAIAFLLILGSTLVAVYTAAAQLRTAQCQADLNRQFLEVLSSRGETADDDRENLYDTITLVAEADSREESERALDDYRARYEQISEGREDYPPLPADVCG